MNTQCPHCRTVFRIGADTLDAADGRVRCGHCREVFDARARLQKEFAFEQTGGLDAGAPRAPGTGGDTAAEQSQLELTPPLRPRVAGLLLSDLEPEAPRPRRGTPSRRSVALWGAANLVLLLALGAQLLLVQRAAFAQDPLIRPILARMCAVTGCSLAPRSAVERIELLRRNVYAHPNADDALIIEARFVNNADFPQPYPVLTVSLGNLGGETLIRRNFRPREYSPALDPNARMAPGSPVNVTLEVRDPGRDATTFQLDFS
jgi:predicted Zn finger-like uncharacterized protein